jgi:hypothetical protein
MDSDSLARLLALYLHLKLLETESLQLLGYCTHPILNVIVCNPGAIFLKGNRSVPLVKSFCIRLIIII